MSRTVVTLYIDEASIRLLVADNRQIRKWGELALEADMVKDGVIVDEAGVAARLKKLVQAQKVSGKKVIVGLSGRNCLSRLLTLPKLPSSLIGEAVKREAERALPVPMEQLYIAWQVIPSSGAEIQVFVVGLPRNATDALVRTLRQAGVTPSLMDLKPLALARAADVDTAIVADVQTAEVDIVVTINRVPQLMRTIPLPAGAQSQAERLAVVEEELRRTINFYNSGHGDRPLSPDMPLLVSGDLVKKTRGKSSVSGELKSAALPLTSLLRCPKQLDTSRYMTNIGLALKGAKASSSLVNLNALPEAYRPKVRSAAEILAVPGMVTAAAVLIPLVVLVQNASANTVSLQTQLDATNQLNKQRQTQQKDVADLKKKVVDTVAARDAYRKALANFSQSQEQLNDDLKAVTSLLADNVTLRSVSHTVGGLTLNGTAPGEDLVLGYATRLRESHRFSRVTVSSIVRTGEQMVFRLALAK